MANPLQSKQGAAGETPGAGSTGLPPSEPWQVRGIEDVYYQREAQIGWWTVLGGVAIGALLTQLSAVAEQVQAGRWSVAICCVTTALLIALAWVTSAWGPLVVRWRISVSMALLHLCGDLALAVLSLQVTNPPGWMLAACAQLVFAILIQVYLARSGAWAVFDAAHTARLKRVACIWGVFATTALAAGLLLLRYPGRLHETVWSVVALSSTVAALWLQEQGMNRERAILGIP